MGISIYYWVEKEYACEPQYATMLSSIISFLRMSPPAWVETS